MQVPTSSTSSIVPANPSFQTPELIGRRTFLKRTAGTVLVCVMAVDAFGAEAPAEQGGGSSGHWEVKLVSATPTPIAPEDAVGTHSWIDQDDGEKLTARISCNVWKAVGQIAKSWSVSASCSSTKSTNNVTDRAILMSHGFGVGVSDEGKLNVADGGGDLQKADMPLIGGMSINATVSEDGKSANVVVKFLAGWDGGALNGLGFTIGPVGGSASWSSQPATPVEYSMSFSFVPVWVK